MTASRSPEEVQREIAVERDQLAQAVAGLRGEIAGAKSAGGRRLVLLAGGAAGLGFVLAGGIGATIRLLAARKRR